MILLDGPFRVIFDHASGYIHVVHASTDDNLPFEVVFTEKISPPAPWSKMRLDDGSFRLTEFSCQRFHYLGNSGCILAHIVISSSSTQKTSIYSDGVDTYHCLCIAKKMGNPIEESAVVNTGSMSFAIVKDKSKYLRFYCPKNKLESLPPFTRTCSFPGSD